MSEEDRKPESEGPGHGRDLTTGSIPRHVIAFSAPMLIGSGINTAYSFVNAVWVGRYLGTNSMAAITDSFPVFFTLMALAIGLTMAAGILVAQTYGAKDWARLRRVVQNSVVLTTLVSATFTVVGYIFAEDLLRLLNTEGEVLHLAAGYMRVYLWSMPLMFGMFLIVSLLRGIGDSKTPVYFQGGSLILNIILDPVFMFGWLGFPRLGLNGAAVASIVSMVAALAALLIYIYRRDHVIAPDWRRLTMDLETSWNLVRIGLPAMFQNMILSISMMAIIGMVNTFGAIGTAAYGAATRIDQVAFLPAMTINMAVATLAGQNIGAGRYERVGEVFRWGLVLSCGLTLVASVVAVGFSAHLLGWFSRDPEVVRVGAHYLRLVGAAYMLFAVMFVSNGIINGSGHTLVTMIISFVALLGVRVPLAAYLSRSMHSLDGIWYAVIISFAVGMLISVSYYFSGLWKRPVIQRAPLPGGADPALDAVPE